MKIIKAGNIDGTMYYIGQGAWSSGIEDAKQFPDVEAESVAVQLAQNNRVREMQGSQEDFTGMYNIAAIGVPTKDVCPRCGFEAPCHDDCRKEEDNWPFISHDMGAIHKDKWYGFGDAGSLTGEYESREAGINHIMEEYLMQVSTDPEDLGEVSICLLTGEQFVARLRQVDDISTYGQFIKKEETAK